MHLAVRRQCEVVHTWATWTLIAVALIGCATFVLIAVAGPMNNGLWMVLQPGYSPRKRRRVYRVQLAAVMNG
jgi:hypothetical protein